MDKRTFSKNPVNEKNSDMIYGRWIGAIKWARGSVPGLRMS